MYVILWVEHLRDGLVQGACPQPTVEEALATIDQLANGFGGRNMTFRMFSLGGEIPLVSEVVETPQPVTTSRKFGVKG